MRALALIAIVVLTACGSGTTTPSAAPGALASAEPSATVAARPTIASAPATPTATPAPVVWPLTGMKADDPAKVKRRPLNVRLPNDPSGRPQVGLAKADIVFEMIVEGGVTRYSAIFQSQDPQAIGPVRSYRWSDLHITQMLRGALVSSGATIEERDAVTNSVRAGNMISVDDQRVACCYYRVGGRGALNNLFVDPAGIREAVNAAGGKDPVDVPPLAFLKEGMDPVTAGGFKTGQPATSVVVPLREPATFTWDEAAKGYRRSQGGARTVDPDGNVPILAKNVVVMHTDIWETSVVEDIFGSKGLDYRMTGGGAVNIFRDGRRVDGTWKRDDPLDMFTFYDQAGEQILLEPGQSWMYFLLPATPVTSEP